MTADEQVKNYLEEIQVTYHVQHLHMGEESNWKFDKWLTTFDGEQFQFKTGLGHRAPPTGWAANTLKARYGPSYMRTRAWRDACTLVKPTAASVLYCLLLDAQSSVESFNNWCANYGYDTDSRKAMQVYLACQEINGQLSKVFKPEQREHLQNLLEDY